MAALSLPARWPATRPRPCFNLPVAPPTITREPVSNHLCWSVPRPSMQGDLLLIYTSGREGCIGEIFKVAGPVAHVKAGWKPGKDWAAPIRRVCPLHAPLHLVELKDSPVLKNAGFVRGKMRARCNVTQSTLSSSSESESSSTLRMPSPFFAVFSEAALHSPTHRDMFMCVVK